MSTALVAAGSALFVLLGIAHAVFSFQSKPDGGPMMPTNPDVRAAMSVTGGIGMEPGINSTLYQAWIGFNLSHAVGVVGLASVLLWHAIDDLAAAATQAWFVTLAVAVPVTYFLLAVRFWFAKPRDAIAFGSVLIWLGLAIELL